MLDELKDLVKVCESDQRHALFSARHHYSTCVGDVRMYCPRCGGDRRMHITTKASPLKDNENLDGMWSLKPEDLVPSLFRYICVECDAEFAAVVYRGPNGPDLAVHSSVHGGVTTPHTPPGVAYYLDQARRAELGGANSAALAMYRGALEHLLFEQGYTDGMCGKKIAELEKDITSGGARKWAVELKTDVLKVIKELGDGAIHPNDGDVQRQRTLDNELLAKVRSLFKLLLYKVYEAELEEQELLKGLREKADDLTK
jgi:hypothetical protein